MKSAGLGDVYFDTAAYNAVADAADMSHGPFTLWSLCAKARGRLRRRNSGIHLPTEFVADILRRWLVKSPALVIQVPRTDPIQYMRTHAPIKYKDVSGSYAQRGAVPPEPEVPAPAANAPVAEKKTRHRRGTVKEVDPATAQEIYNIVIAFIKLRKKPVNVPTIRNCIMRRNPLGTALSLKLIHDAIARALAEEPPVIRLIPAIMPAQYVFIRGAHWSPRAYAGAAGRAADTPPAEKPNALKS